MKNIYILILLLLGTGVVYGQRTVISKVKNTNGDSLVGKVVYMYPDTNQSNPPFQLIQQKTDSFGVASFQLPSNVSTGTVFYVSTLDCDSVSYKINTHIYAGNNINSPLIVCVTPPTNFSGYVYLGDASKRPKVKDAQVYLISKCGTMLNYIDSVETDTNGYYAVDSFPIQSTGCEVIMRAALKSTSADYKKYLPAYHKNNSNYDLKWSGARDIPLQVARQGINIILPEAINPTGGPSTISGYAKDSLTNNRLPDKIMFVTDMQDVTVDYTFTDASGEYAFTNLPFGTYKVFGDVWGKDNIDFIATINANKVNILNLVFIENSTEYKGYIATSVAGRNDLVNTISIFPNPARDRIYIKGADNIPGQKIVELTDITGAKVYNSVYTAGQPVTVPVMSLPAGVYILRLSTETETAVFRVAK
ncbi:MAG: T9SS type A sorting domain-containing protein [Chitinophagales bacterium]|nr:T9SS type A sorting domain-containing protein [Chitinophagales bacterium]